MPNVVLERLQLCNNFETKPYNINKIYERQKYSMTKSRIKGISAIVLAIILAASSAIGVNAAAHSLEYSASSSYSSSVYYDRLMSVKLTGDNVTDIVNVAKSQVGYHEGYRSGDYTGYSSGSGNVTEYGRWYGNQSYWCNVFVSWCAYVAGVEPSVFPKLAGVGNAYYSTLPSVGADTFSFSSGRALQPGDLIFCCTCSGGYGCIDHVGLVTGVDATSIYTVEGNMSDQVKACTYSADSGYSSALRSRINYVARPDYNYKTADIEELGNSVAVKSAGNKVFALFDMNVTYGEAKKIAKGMGGKLTTVKSEEKAELISELCEKGSLGKYFIKAEECSVIDAEGTVYEASPDNRYTGFICEINVEKLKPVNAASFGGSRYEIYDTNVTFEQARAIAKAKGGKLTVIESDTELMLLSLLFKESDSYFTGLRGSEKKLTKKLDAYVKGTEFEDSSICVAINGQKNGLSVYGGYDSKNKTGFIVEYADTEKHTVIYDTNGGENAPFEKIGAYGESVIITSFKPVKSGKTFLGWSYEKKSKTVDFVSGERLQLTGDVTLYAVWQ